MAANPKFEAFSQSEFAQRLRSGLEGEVYFDSFSRGRYSTDASIYQISPIGVVIPRSWQDVVCALQISKEAGVPVLPRGAGTSQCGQTVAEALVIDNTAYLSRLIEIDRENQTVIVEPGVVLDHLNRALAKEGLMFPVDVSTGSRATIGGMTGNNSCGARSIRYGTMRDNVRALEAILIDGSRHHFGPSPRDNESNRFNRQLFDIGDKYAEEAARRFPDVQRRVGGYNIDALARTSNGITNLAHLLVGSEGTLAYSERIQLHLANIPGHKVLGVCHFPTFYAAMDSAQHIVKLGPSAVELVDRTMIELARDIPMFRDVIGQIVVGQPDALLLVEFSGDDLDTQLQGLKQLQELMSDLGFSGGVTEALNPGFQKEIWEVRKSGLNIMMSMRGDGKPVSFIEDCAVRLEDLAEYTRRLTEIFSKYETSGTWYAHASVGCLHVRPILNVKQDIDVIKMRAIAEEAFEMVREYKGSHSGEHGDGLVRSEFHEAMFGKKMIAAFAEVKNLFDPNGLLNPGKIVRPSKMDDRSLFRYKPGYKTQRLKNGLDWSAWSGFGGAVEMCNNNGACRKFDSAVMCPSYRITREEKHLTRGRANSLRLAISGQLGPSGFTDPELYDSMKLCVGCKGCKRECPTGVDMAKMKIEFLHHYHQRHNRSLRDHLISSLPKYAPALSRFSTLANSFGTSPLARVLADKILGLSAKRSLPIWHKNSRQGQELCVGSGDLGEVVLFADTFNRYFEPDNLSAAIQVLTAAGFKVHQPVAVDGEARPLCCGRTYLSTGMVDKARAEANRTIEALKPYLQRKIPILGLEPSCLFTFKDEFLSLIDDESAPVLAKSAMLLEEFLAGDGLQGFSRLKFQRTQERVAWVHGHCHQKAFSSMDAVEQILQQVPDLTTKMISSGCCGMAGAFGYQSETHDASMAMAQLDLVPALEAVDRDDWLLADGFSCRHQISDVTHKSPRHVAQFLARSLQ
ncbi:FAD-binding and (Fe-S)-binding domain-containing protein [Gammaproteobacteria bacterium]|nr:FAD-binding and (Fe-S)-binding domain-containing protein [Gammaproteobacteria bacterium]